MREYVKLTRVTNLEDVRVLFRPEELGHNRQTLVDNLGEFDRICQELDQELLFVELVLDLDLTGLALGYRKVRGPHIPPSDSPGSGPHSETGTGPVLVSS